MLSQRSGAGGTHAGQRTKHLSTPPHLGFSTNRPLLAAQNPHTARRSVAPTATAESSQALEASLLDLRTILLKSHRAPRRGKSVSSVGGPMQEHVTAFHVATPFIKGPLTQGGHMSGLTPLALRTMLEVEAIIADNREQAPRHEILTLPELVSIGKAWPLLRFVFPNSTAKELSQAPYTQQYSNFLAAIEPSLQELTSPAGGARSRSSNLMVCLECIHAMLMVGRVPSTKTWLAAIATTAQHCERLMEMDRKLWPAMQVKKDSTLLPVALLGHALARMNEEPGVAVDSPTLLAELSTSPEAARLVSSLAGVLAAYTCDGNSVEFSVAMSPSQAAPNSGTDESSRLKNWSAPEQFITPAMGQDRVRNEYLPCLYALATLSGSETNTASLADDVPPQPLPVYPGYLLRTVSMASYRPHICHSRSTTNLAWAQLATVVSRCLSLDVAASLEGVRPVTFALAECYEAAPSSPSVFDLGALGPHEVAMWGSEAATNGWVEGLQSWTLDAKPVGKGGAKVGGFIPKFPPDTAAVEASVMPSVLAALVEIGGYMPVPHRPQLVDALDRAVVAWQGAMPVHRLGPLMSSLGRMQKAAAIATEENQGLFSLPAKESDKLSDEMMKRCWPEAGAGFGELFAAAAAAVGVRHASHMGDLKQSGGLARELMRLGIMPDE